MLRNASATTAEREALKLGIEYLTMLFSTEVTSFVFQVESTDRAAQYKLNAQSLRLFGLHRDVNDAHRAGANRLQNKTNSPRCGRSRIKVDVLRRRSLPEILTVPSVTGNAISSFFIDVNTSLALRLLAWISLLDCLLSRFHPHTTHSLEIYLARLVD